MEVPLLASMVSMCLLLPSISLTSLDEIVTNIQRRPE